MIPRTLFRARARTEASSARAPDGQRIYAIGDVHGRADLLDLLLAKIDADNANGADRPVLVFLGDYVDRGCASRAVIDRLLRLDERRYALVFLRGNHEEALLEFLDRPESGSRWMRIGGRQTLESYGVEPPGEGAAPSAYIAAAEALRAALPPAHRDFIERLQMSARFGDYLFVHAGLRPGRALDAQSAADMLEIREPFLSSKRRWPFVVVHGHSPVERPFRDERRIAIDTGAYATGKLSAVRLEGADAHFIEAMA